MTRKAENLSREVLIGPKVTRRLILGDVYEPQDKAAMTVTCKAMPKLAENAAAGKCRARLEGTIDAQQFYPASAKRQGIEGDAVVRYWIPPGSDVPVDAEIVRSSGYPALDAAAIDTIRSGQIQAATATMVSAASASHSNSRTERASMFHIVIFEPEIPPNTGNLIRLSANTGAELHLIKPIGFRLDRKSVRRAGLDYDELATVRVHDNYAAARAALAGQLVRHRNRQHTAPRRCAIRGR